MISEQALLDFKQHCLVEYPNEACGVIQSAKYIRCKNSSRTPKTDFCIQATELLHLSINGPIEAVLHSHPYDPSNPPLVEPEWPSHNDMLGWIADGIPWGIVATDGQGISPILWMDDSRRAPLVGRQFIHGIQDCYSLVRDYFHEKSIELPNFARGWDWWHQGEDHYLKNFELAGFSIIPKKDAVPGDCVMYKIRGPVIHHSAVITGENTILHHLTRRASGFQSKSDWARFEAYTVRYTGKQ